MKKAFWLMAVLILSALAVVVWKQPVKITSQPAPTNMEFNYTYDKREVFYEDAGADLSEFDQRIKELSGRAANAGTNVQARAQVKIEDLRNERAVLGQKLDALRNAREANWNDLKSNFQRSEDELKASFKEVSQWLANQTRS
jgi:hypothetical protein